MDTCDENVIRQIAITNKTEHLQVQSQIDLFFHACNSTFVVFVSPKGLESLLHNLSKDYGQQCISGLWHIFRDIYPNATAKYESQTTEEISYKMDATTDVFWTVVFSTMLVCAISGNLVVFWIVLGHRRMHNVTNYFLVNLSTADLMMSCLNTSFNFTFMKSR